MKKNLLIILSGLVGVILLIVFLYYNYASNNIRQNYLKNGGFKRSNLSFNLSLKQEYNLNKGYYNIAGLKDGIVFIKDAGKREISLFHPDHTKSIISLPKSINPENIFNISINAFEKSAFDVQSNNDKKIFVVDINTNKILRTLAFENYFDKAIRLSDNKFFTISSGKEFDKMNMTITSFDRDHELVEKVSNFSIVSMVEDGMFQKYNQGAIYINFYNNSFFAIDSNLNKVFVSKTIDTITTLPKTVSLKNNTITKFIKQPRPVNQISSISGDHLFIYSLVRDNIDMKELQHNGYIDVYNLKEKGKYIGTIDLGNYNLLNIQDMLVQDNNLVILYTDKLLIYEFTL